MLARMAGQMQQRQPRMLEGLLGGAMGGGMGGGGMMGGGMGRGAGAQSGIGGVMENPVARAAMAASRQWRSGR